MKSAKKAIDNMKNVVALPRANSRREKEEIAFLPAALEIVETPPSPIGRAIGATLVALFCLALIWACFGHIDIVASASGKIVPSGRVTEDGTHDQLVRKGGRYATLYRLQSGINEVG